MHTVITGGSKGLGKEIASILLGKGTDVTLIARDSTALEAAQRELTQSDCCGNLVNYISVDLSNSAKTEEAFRSWRELPDVIYCAAGGAVVENGFLRDISPCHVEDCMRNNYLTAAFAAQTMLKLWLEDDAKKRMSLSNGFKPSEQRKRRIVFICSTAVFVGLPGYDAYTPAKAAVRALADILRSEVYQYSGAGAISDYKIHCAFPSNFGSAAFLEEQKHKPVMTCRFEGTLVESEEELLKRVPTARYVAERIVHGVEQGKDFVILDGSVVSELLYAGMRGPSPARGLGLVDCFASLAMLAVWPWLRRRLDRLCAGNKDI